VDRPTSNETKVISGPLYTYRQIHFTSGRASFWRYRSVRGPHVAAAMILLVGGRTVLLQNFDLFYTIQCAFIDFCIKHHLLTLVPKVAIHFVIYVGLV